MRARCRCRCGGRDGARAARRAAASAGARRTAAARRASGASARHGPAARSIAWPSSSIAGPISASSCSPSGLSMDRLVAPLEQRTADDALQRLDPARQRRRGQSERFRGGLDRAQPRDLDERLDRGERRQSASSSGLRLCGAHRTLLPVMRRKRADIRCATSASVAYLLRTCTITAQAQKGPAFQASSPKNFQGRSLGTGPFFACAAAWLSALRRLAAHQRPASRHPMASLRHAAGRYRNGAWRSACIASGGHHAAGAAVVQTRGAAHRLTAEPDDLP